MNLQLYKAVLGRFRWVVLAGILLGVGLALLSYVRVSVDDGVSITHRKQEVWESTVTLLLTDGSFPLGRDPRLADPYRFTGLAGIYARLASSDEVRRLIAKKGRPVPGRFSAAPDYTRRDFALPTMTTFGQAPSPSAAKEMVARGTKAFISYLTTKQSLASIPPSQRVRLEIVSSASEPRLLVPRSKTLPIMVLLAVLTATIAFVFVLENLQPRVLQVRVFADEAAGVQPEPPVHAVAEEPAGVQPESGVRIVVQEPADEQPVPRVEAEEKKGVITRRWA